MKRSKFGHKPSLVNPVIIVVAILLVIGGSYVFFGAKKDTANKETAENSAEKAEVKSTGLDQSAKVETVADVENVIAKWVEANPKAIVTAVNNMQKQAMEEQAKNAKQNVSSKKDELFKDKNSPTYSAGRSDVNVVEFFDYACGYCKKVQVTVEELLAEDKKVKIIYKEFPILGQNSEDLATVALAVNIVSPSSYRKFHNALMTGNVNGKEEAIKVAKDLGVDAAKLEKTLTNDKEKIAKMIQANRALATSIGVNGTPGFIIGEELIPGALDIAAFKAKIAAARK